MLKNRVPGFMLFFYISCGMGACSSTRGNAKALRDFEKFPTTSTQIESRLLDVELATPELMTIYKDSLLLVVNNLNRNSHHVRVFDIGQRKAIKDIMPVSQKRGGTLSFMSFNISDSLVWVFDVAKNGFIVANLDALLNGDGNLNYYSEYRLTPQVFYYDAMLLNRNEALVNCNYDTDEKLTYINLSDNTLNKVLLSYQKDTTIGSSRVDRMSYESFMLLKPDKKKLLMACRYADQVELLDLASGKYKRIRGPLGFPPRLDPFKDNTGVVVGTPGLETRYGFLKGQATSDFFYLLFSGYQTKTPHRFYGNKIFVFDWEGNPVRQIILKNDIVSFSVSSDNRMLYTLNAQTKRISFSELKW